MTEPDVTPATGTRPLPAPPTLVKAPLLVGREREVERLHGWLEQARQGVQQVVFVTGSPALARRP